MKVANPRIIRLAGLVGGSIIEPGDGELIFPPLLTNVTEVGDPVTRGYASSQDAQVPALMTQSFMRQRFSGVAGALAQAATLMVTVGKGLWHFHWATTFSFSGTTNVGQSPAALIFDDIDTNNFEVCVYPNLLGTHSNSGDFVIALERDGFAWRIRTATTIAADNLFIGASVIGKRLM